MVVNNPRHPHTCVVYRMIGQTSLLTEAKKVILYEGICRKYTTHGARTTSATITSQYTLSVPEFVQAKAGDIVEVDDRIGHFKGTVTEVNCGNLGTDIYWTNAKI